MKFQTFIFIVFCLFIVPFTNTKAQTITLIPSPEASNKASNGYLGSPIIFKNNLYVSYLNSGGKRQLAKYENNKLTLISNPDDGLGVYGTPIIFKNELYFIYKITENEAKLAKFDGLNITLLQNVYSNAFFFAPIIYKEKLYFPVYDANSNGKLAEFDGTTIKELDITIQNGSFDNFPVIYRDTLCYSYFVADTLKILKYCNNKISIVNTPKVSMDRYFTHLTVFNNDLYCIFKDRMDIYGLAKYNGVSLISIPNPDTTSSGGRGFSGKPFVYKGALYGVYYDKTSKGRLAKFDGTKMTLITNPDAGSFTEFPLFQDKIIYKDALYSTYNDARNRYTIAKFDGNSATIINTPDPGDSYRGYIGQPIIYNNELYGIATSGFGAPNQMIRYDGNSAKFVTKPDLGPGFINIVGEVSGTDRRGASIVFNGELLTFYQDANFSFRLLSIKTTPLAVHEKISDIQIFPNPTSDKLKIIAPQQSFTSITVVNSLGEPLLYQPFSENSEIDLTTLTKGFYMVILKSNSTMLSKKIVKL